ncbi:putative enoyl-[acyl-carrier-protein] reductase II [Listeria fleischmannii subsp. fleischmannii]|nr:putative enoyl-[acyl-carrier-protein] reductase II [Listeria fleischmannii subsp. fleischmannii]
MIKEYLRLEDENVDRDTLEALTLGSLRKAVLEGDTENGSIMAGQITGMITEIKSCEALITEMMEEAKRVSKQLSVE